jgi:hypothetical protein
MPSEERAGGHGRASQAAEEEAHGRQDAGGGRRRRRDECALGAQVGDRSAAVPDEAVPFVAGGLPFLALQRDLAPYSWQLWVTVTALILGAVFTVMTLTETGLAVYWWNRILTH